MFVNCALELFFEDNFGEDFIANATDEVTEAILSCDWRSGGLSVVARKTCVLVVMTIFGNFSIYFVVSIIYEFPYFTPSFPLFFKI